jgi:hypothetical protein
MQDRESGREKRDDAGAARTPPVGESVRGAEALVVELIEAVTAIAGYAEAAARLSAPENPSTRHQIAEALERCRPQIARAGDAARKLYAIMRGGGERQP